MAGFLFGLLCGSGGLVYGIHLGSKYKSYDAVLTEFKRLFRDH